MVTAIATAGVAHLASAIMAVGNYIGMAADESWTEAKADIMGLSSSVVAHTVSVAAAIVANALALAMYKGQLKPDNVKSAIERRRKRARIEMKNSGEISIDTSASNQAVTVDSGTAIITLKALNEIVLETQLVKAKKGLRTKNIMDMGI